MPDILPCKFCGASASDQDNAWSEGIWCCDAANQAAKDKAEAKRKEGVDDPYLNLNEMDEQMYEEALKDDDFGSDPQE